VKSCLLEKDEKEESVLAKKRKDRDFCILYEFTSPKKRKVLTEQQQESQPLQVVTELPANALPEIVVSSSPSAVCAHEDGQSSVRSPTFAIPSIAGVPVRLMLEEDKEDQDESDHSDHGSSMEEESAENDIAGVNSVAGEVITAGVEGEFFEAAPVERSWWQFFVDCLQFILPRWSS
jgi:hypothetical protein